MLYAVSVISLFYKLNVDFQKYTRSLKHLREHFYRL